MTHRRRDFLKALAALGIGSLPQRGESQPAAAPATAAIDFCGTGVVSQPLFVPSGSGFLGRLELGDDRLELRAAPSAGDGDTGAPEFGLTYRTRYKGRDYRNPTLVMKSGKRVRVDFVNDIDEPTIVHWHGLAVDSRNDGNGLLVVEPGRRFAYDFEVKDRAALYWYHPHPHGMTAGQAYRGLFGMIEVEDADERALRSALDLTLGQTEIPLVLQDRRPGGYVISAHDTLHGFLGEVVLVNGTSCPHLDVTSRIHRFRVLNASNARTYRLGLRTADGKTLPFALIGGDGGLLRVPRRCEEAFISTAERLDILVDFSSLPIGDSVMLDTRAFDAMHRESAVVGPAAGKGAGAVDHAAMGHVMPPPGPGAAGMAAFVEGTVRTLLELRVRERVDYRKKVPAALSRIAPIDIVKATERPIRLGFSNDRWRINDEVFAMGATPIVVKRNTVETWVIRNSINSMPHAMHLHGFHFQVLDRGASPEHIWRGKIDDQGRVASDDGWKDTVLVWPGESVRIAIDFRMAFPGPQVYMLHCHNLEHEDAGMMIGVKVI